MKEVVFTLSILAMCLLTGCDTGGSDENHFQKANPSAPLTITNFYDGMVVHEDHPIVEGIGYKEGMYLTVKTDKWYPQVDAIYHDENNSWYTWVYLKGEGKFNNHTIRAVAPSGEISEVSGIVVVP